MLSICVCVKQVPESPGVSVTPAPYTLNRGSATSIINPFDEHALEAALELKSQHQAKVSIISMGPEGAEAVLREAIARGGDAAYLVSDAQFAGSDTLVTSRVLSETIKRCVGKTDLILFGRQAIDGDTGHVGPAVAEFLDVPVVTFARKMSLDGTRLRVERVVETGYEVIEVALPAAVTLLKEANRPRMASLRGKMIARKAAIHKIDAASLTLAPSETGLPGSPTRVVDIAAVEHHKAGTHIEGTDAKEQAEQLAVLIRKIMERRP